MLNDKSHADKRVRALHRELKLLRMRTLQPPVHVLRPPIQRGWKRHFVMTRAARERTDHPTLELILAHLNTVQYFWRPDFRYTRRQSSGRGLIPIEQELMAVSQDDWEREKLGLVWQKYFRWELVAVQRVQRWSRKDKITRWHKPHRVREKRNFVWAHSFRYPSLFELRVEKHWQTHYYEIETDVLARIAWIERWMDHHNGRKRYENLKGYSSRVWLGRDERQLYRANEARREMRAQLGFLDREAAENIPSTQPCGGARRVGCLQPLRFMQILSWVIRLFCGSEAGDTSLQQNHPTETARSHRIPALRARVAGPGVARCAVAKTAPAGHFRANRMPGRQTADAVCQSEVQANGPGRFSGRLSPQKHPPDVLTTSGPVEFLSQQISRQ